MISKEKANAIFDLLVVHAGAEEKDRRDFLWVTRDDAFREYRFCGHLGFGGKFWASSAQWYVNCYLEDMTPARLKIITTTTALLQTLKEKK